MIARRLVNLEYENTDLKAKVNSLNAGQARIRGDLDSLKKHMFTVGVIEDANDIAQLQEFLEKMRKDKENKNEIKPWEEQKQE